MTMTRAEINAFGEAIKAQLLDDDADVLVLISALQPSTECDEQSCTAMIEGWDGNEIVSFTGHAIALEDAIWLARGKLRAAREKHAAEKAKAAKPKEINP